MRRLVLLGLAFAACEKAGDGRKTVDQPLPRVTVTLVDAGAAPRAPLRFHPEQGATATYEFTVDKTDHRRRIEHDALQFVRVESRVVAVEADGHFDQHERVIDVGIRARSLDDLHERSFEDMAAALRGAEIEARYDARGRLEKETTTFAPSVERDKPYPLAYEHSMVLPDEPVGPGAHWRFVAQADEERATVEATLVSMQGDELEVRSTFTAVHSNAVHVVGTADWHLDLASGHTISHAQERLTREDDRDWWRDETVDVAPVN